MTQIGELEMDQSWERDGVFYNNVYANFTLLNNSDKVLAVTKVKSEYLTSQVCSIYYTSIIVIIAIIDIIHLSFLPSVIEPISHRGINISISLSL